MSPLRLALAATFVVAAFLVAASWEAPTEVLARAGATAPLLGYVTYVALLALAVVLAPLTVLPLIPVASATFGPFLTALLSVVGWTVGAVLAFLIARRLGRPLISRSVSLEAVDRFAATLTGRERFVAIVLLRLAVPVDLASYALGLTGSLGLAEYTLATAVGVTWFSFAFAYLGEALLTGNARLFVGVGASSALVFTAAWWWLRRQRERRND